MISQAKLKVALLVLLSAFLNNCKEHYPTPPLPEFASEYNQPETKTFTLGSPEPIEWETADFPELSSFPKTNFRWDQLPTQPFNLSNTTQVDSLESVPFSLEGLPTKPLNYDNWPSNELVIQQRKLGEPKIVKAGSPTILPQSSRGVVALSEEFGYDGSIYGVYIDEENFVWLGGTNSIIKFDSENLEIYGIDQGVYNTNVTEIFKDSKGRMWFAGIRGINVIDFENETVTEIENEDTASVIRIIEDHLGRFWFAVNGVGYKVLDLEKNTVKTYGKAEGLVNTFAVRLIQDQDKKIWLGTGDGINILDFENNTSTLLNFEDEDPRNGTYELIIDKKDRLWIGDDGGVKILNKERNSIKFLQQSDAMDNFTSIVSIIQDDQGIYWFGSINGRLFSYDEENNTMETFDILPGNHILYQIHKNDEGQVWMSEVNGGLYVFDSKGFRPANFTVENGLGDNNVWSTLKSKDGKMYIGTYNGIDIYDPNTSTIKHLGTANGLKNIRNTQLYEDQEGRIWSFNNAVQISIIDPKEQTITEIPTGQTFNLNSFTAMLEDSNGIFWLGDAKGNILKIDTAEGTLYKSNIDYQTENYRINSLSALNEYIWGSTTGKGVFGLNKKRDSIIFVNDENGLNSSVVFASNIDQSDNLWVATLNGLEMLNFRDSTITTFTTAEGLAASDVYDVISRDGKVYAGTSKGFSVIQDESEEPKKPFYSVKNIGRAQGLTYSDIAQNSSSFDSEGRLWAGASSQILTVIDEVEPDSSSISLHITGFNILEKKQYFKNNNQDYSSKNDSLNPSSTASPNKKNQVEDARDKGMQWSSIEGPYDLPTDLKLPPEQNYLSFNYHGIKFMDHNTVVYRYFLEGIDKNWSSITRATTSENYRDLPPGDYNFEVVAKSADNPWTEPRQFKFTILPYWYQTWWSKVLFGLVLSIIIWFIIYYRSLWLKEENKILEQRVSERTEQLRNKIEELKSTQSQLIQSEKMASLGELTAGIAHEIQNPLNFVNNFSDVNRELIDEMQEDIKNGNYEEALLLSEDIKSNEEKIMHHGKRADSIVKGMLQHSRNNVGEKEPIDINALCEEYIRLAYHGLRAKDKTFNATLETHLDPSIEKVNVVPQDLGRVILNILNNAFYAVKEKSKSGIEDYVPKVEISTLKEPRQVLITIKDNGTGIPETAKDKIFQPFYTTKTAGNGTGLGLSLSYDIVKSHNGELKVSSIEGEGTEFTILIPRNQPI